MRPAIRPMTVVTKSFVRRELKLLLDRPQARSEYRNVFHCCVQKTGSRWIRRVLADPRIFRFSGLVPYTYETKFHEKNDPRKLTERLIDKPFPPRTIGTPLYLSWDCFDRIPKGGPYRAFFVMRDPRDIVVSEYFSLLYSHTPIADISSIRHRLSVLPLDMGLTYVIDSLNEFELFSALQSWTQGTTKDINVKLVRFEELIVPQNFGPFAELLSHCGIHVPEDVLRAVLDTYGFERLSRGRQRGEEDQRSHYRKGTAGDWNNYFSPPVAAHFRSVTGDLVSALGYEAT